jgi:hypothetical protein
MDPGQINCPKTTARPLTLSGVVPESGGARSGKQNISSDIEQIVKCLAHLEMLAHFFRKGTKSDTRKVIDREPAFLGLSNGNMPVHSALTSGSPKRSLRVTGPMLSVTSCIIIFTKIRRFGKVFNTLLFGNG